MPSHSVSNCSSQVLFYKSCHAPVTQDLASSTQEMETGQACRGHQGPGKPHFRCSISEFFSRVAGKMLLWLLTGGLIFPWRVAKRWCWAAMLQTIGMMYFTYKVGTVWNLRTCKINQNQCFALRWWFKYVIKPIWLDPCVKGIPILKISGTCWPCPIERFHIVSHNYFVLPAAQHGLGSACSLTSNLDRYLQLIVNVSKLVHAGTEFITKMK